MAALDIGIMFMSGTRHVVALTLLAVLSAREAPALELTAQKGIAAGWGWETLPDAELNRRLADCVALGVKWLRFDVSWSEVQARGSDSWDWKGPDRIISALTKHRIKALPILDTTPVWARRNPTSSYWTEPKIPEDYGNFVSSFVGRYPSIEAVEIWNEPNVKTFWGPKADAQNYGKLLEVAYHAVKRTRKNVSVVSGGLAPATTGEGNISPEEFIRAIYSRGANKYFDALGLHPYSYPASPGERQSWNAWNQMVDRIRPLMEEQGDQAKLIWMTEFGAPTGGAEGTYVTEVGQLKQMETAYRLAHSYSWAGPIFWYSFKDIDSSDAKDRENHFGIVRSNGDTKPAYAKFQDIN